MKQGTVPRYAAIVLLGLTSCKGLAEPVIDIQVRRDGSGYAFSFTACGSSLFRGGEVGVSDILVLKGAGPPNSLPVQCEVTKEAPSVRNLTGHWQYGTTPQGYKMPQCDSLKPGETYQVHAGANAPNGRRTFTLTANGDVTLGASSCH